MVKLIHLFTSEVNTLGTLLQSVVVHSWRGLIGGYLMILMERFTLGHSFQGIHDYFIVGEVGTFS
jgi:hypothetical protein